MNGDDDRRRVVVVGLGYFSQFHLDAWTARSDVALVGVSDLDADRVATAARRWQVPGFVDPAAMLDETDPDIVDLVVPPFAQADLVAQCARPSRLIICQKPFGRSLAEAEAMTGLALERGARLIVHENFRFQPWYRTIKRFLSDGRMGQVYQCRFALRPGDGRGGRAYLDRQPTFQQMPRFLVQETGVHFIDLFRWLFGDIQSIYADLRRLNPAIAGEDAGVLVMQHAGGVQSVFDGNRLADHVADNTRMTMGEMVIEGEGGQLALDGFGHVTFRPFGSANAEDVPINETVDRDSFGGGCVAALIAHAVEALSGRGTLENSASDYLDVIRVSDAAYLSDREKRRVAL